MKSVGTQAQVLGSVVWWGEMAWYEARNLWSGGEGEILFSSVVSPVYVRKTNNSHLDAVCMSVIKTFRKQAALEYVLNLVLLYIQSTFVLFLEWGI